ncbi:MAG: peptidylprolyl isomerase [bacterium]
MKKKFFLFSVLLLSVVCLSGCLNKQADEAKEALSTKVGIATNKAEDAANKAKEEVNNKIEDTTNTIKNEVNDKIEDATNKVQDAANELKNEITNKVMDKIQSILDGQDDLVSKYDQALLKTNFGDIKVKFYNDESPKTVNNFLSLANEGFYNGTKFHRVIKDFMIQGGDPNSKDDDWSNDGTGGPGYKFEDEFNENKLVKGSLAMANAGPNTNGSQFFIVTAEATPWLDGKHTNFGYVTEGMNVVDKIKQVDKNANDHPTTDVTIESIELIEK